MSSSAIQSAQFGVATESQRGVVNGADARSLVFGGSALSFRNKIINGACLVAQRGSIAAVNNAVTYGGADRFFVAPLSFTTASGTISKSALSGTAAGFGQWLTGCTTTGSGTIVFGQRIESQNTSDLNSKSVTFTGYLYQDTGSTLTTTVTVAKANAVDNFGAITTLGSLNVSVPTATLTSFSLTVSLGSTDASNGLSCTASFPVGAITSKNFAISSWQLEAGSVATPFENRPIGTELALAQRYYQQVSSMLGYATSTTAGRFMFPCVVAMRVAPTTLTIATAAGTISNPAGANGTPSGISLTNSETQALVVTVTSSATMTGTVAGYSLFVSGALTTVSAEL